jgi:cbb3-type cytochrome oxidase maturation protein
MALALGLAALFAFLWSMRNGQYEDMEGAALRVLSDDDV